MGIFADIVEQNAERQGQILQPTRSADLSSSARGPRLPPPVWHSCPECGALFADLNELAKHLRQVCRGRHVYVRLNGRIVRDLAWAPDGISSLEVVRIGSGKGDVHVAVGGTKLTLTGKS